MGKITFFLLHLFAATVPLVFSDKKAQTNNSAAINFPTSFEGVALVKLPLSSREEEFLRGFPGQIGRFTDGEREILIRGVTRPTRKLHPSSDCFKGAGFKVNPVAAKFDTRGRVWGCFKASQGSQQLLVCEMIQSEAGASWYDTSSWFWSAAMSQKDGPWLAYTVVENQG